MITDSTLRQKMLRAWTRCLFLSVLLVLTANLSIGESKHREPLPERPLEEDTTPEFPAQCMIRDEAMQSIAVTRESIMKEPVDSWIPEKQQAKMEDPAWGLSNCGNSTSEQAEWALPLPLSVFDPVYVNQTISFNSPFRTTALEFGVVKTARVKYNCKDNPLPLALIFLFLLFKMVTFIPAGGEEGNNSDITDSRGGGGRTRKPGKPWWKRWFCIVNGNRDDPAE